MTYNVFGGSLNLAFSILTDLILSESWNLLVQCLLWYALVVHVYHMTKPVQSSFSEYVPNPLLSWLNI